MWDRPAALRDYHLKTSGPVPQGRIAGMAKPGV